MSDGQSSHEDVQNKRKRKRQTLSCTECKRRKIKCDHSLPCGPCLSRNDSDKCTFEDGSVPQPQQQYVTLSTFQALQDRFDRLESAFSTRHVDYSIHTAIGATPVESDASVHDIDSAARALADLAAGREIAPPKSTSSSTPIATLTPSQEDAMRSTEPFVTSIINNHVPTKPYDQVKLTKGMNEVLSKLPEISVIMLLVEHYFSRSQLLWHCLHEPTYRNELEQFEWAIQSGTLMTVDPAWIALLAIVLCVSADDIHESFSVSLELQAAGVTHETLRTLPDILFEAFEIALRCAGWLARPQIRVLTALLVFLPFMWDLEPEANNGIGGHRLWLDIAAGIVKILGLHRIGTDCERMPPDDPAFPPGPSSFKRQMACRLFNTLLFHDTFSCAVPSLETEMIVMYSFPQGTYDTEARQNFADEDLGFRVHISPRPLHESTAETLEIHKSRIAMHHRRFNDLVAKPESFTYEALLDCDRDLRENHQDFLHPDLLETHPRNQQTSWMFAMVNTGYHIQLLRLHRPFLTKSYRDSRYMYSQVTALNSARQIIHGHKTLYRSPAKKAWYVYVYHLSAITVRFVHALHTAGKVEECRQELADSLALFKDAAQSEDPAVRRAAGKADHVIAAMLQMLELVRTPVANVSLVMDEVVKAAAATCPSSITNGTALRTSDPVNVSPPLFNLWMNDDTERLLQALETLPVATFEASQPESTFPGGINWQELGINWSQFGEISNGTTL